ncbi:hypothetical protein C365_00951 [Cryptococcus neoformans Bt85]|nr:hypothetical protein C365_00951 [Cryptococcus neoformans var. grubii Bt85]
MTVTHTELNTLDPLPSEIRELIFQQLLLTRHIPLKSALLQTCRKYYNELLPSLYHTVSLHSTMIGRFFQGLGSGLSEEESSGWYSNDTEDESLPPGTCQSPAARRLRLLSLVKMIILEDVGAVQGCLCVINTLSKLDLPNVPQDWWSQEYPGYSYYPFGHLLVLFPSLNMKKHGGSGRLVWSKGLMNQLNEGNYLKLRPRATWSGNDKLEGDYILTHRFASATAVIFMYAPDSPLSPELSSLISVAAASMNRKRCIFADVDPEIFNLIDPLYNISTISWHLRPEGKCKQKHFDGLVSLIRRYKHMYNGQNAFTFYVYGYAFKPYDDPKVVAENLESASYDPNSTVTIIIRLICR